MNEQTVNQFLSAVGERRFDDIERLLAPDAVLRWVTPGGMDEQVGADEVVGRYRTWFGELPQLDALSTHGEPMGGRFIFEYRLRARKPDGHWYLAQQQGVMDCGDEGITAIDLVCTGFRAEPEESERQNVA